jgi:serine/threonine protein phosphatase PrpC
MSDARRAVEVAGPGFWAAGVTDPGPRPRNEDRFLCSADGRFAVIDGMGGEGNGDVAAELALKACAAADNPAVALRAARAAIRGAASGPGLAGMGAVATAVWVRGRSFRLAHLGDTRAYRVGSDAVEQISRDHTARAAAAERGEPVARDGVTADLGGRTDVPFHFADGTLGADEWLVLCSDGVHGAFDDHAFARRLQEIHQRRATPLAAARELVSAALVAGGRDNATAVVVEPERPRGPLAKALPVALVIALSLAAVWWFGASAPPADLPVAPVGGGAPALDGSPVGASPDGAAVVPDGAPTVAPDLVAPGSEGGSPAPEEEGPR